jgi:hypothetical protein
MVYNGARGFYLINRGFVLYMSYVLLAIAAGGCAAGHVSSSSALFALDFENQDFRGEVD